MDTCLVCEWLQAPHVSHHHQSCMIALVLKRQHEGRLRIKSSFTTSVMVSLGCTGLWLLLVAFRWIANVFKGCSYVLIMSYQLLNVNELTEHRYCHSNTKRHNSNLPLSAYYRLINCITRLISRMNKLTNNTNQVINCIHRLLNTNIHLINGWGPGPGPGAAAIKLPDNVIN